MGLDVPSRNKIQIYQTQDFILIREAVPILLNNKQCFQHVAIFSLGTLYEQKIIKYRPWSYTSTNISWPNYLS